MAASRVGCWVVVERQHDSSEYRPRRAKLRAAPDAGSSIEADGRSDASRQGRKDDVEARRSHLERWRYGRITLEVRIYDHRRDAASVADTYLDRGAHERLFFVEAPAHADERSRELKGPCFLLCREFERRDVARAEGCRGSVPDEGPVSGLASRVECALRGDRDMHRWRTGPRLNG